MKPLTWRQMLILNFLHETMKHRGYPPSVREIGQAVGLSSPSSVHAQLATLEARGCIQRDPKKARAIIPIVSHIYRQPA